MSNRELQKRANTFILTIVVIAFVVVSVWVIAEDSEEQEDPRPVPGQEVEGSFYTETVPVSDGQVECVALDSSYGTGLSCNWNDMRKED